MAKKKYRIMLTDDHPLVLEPIISYLKEEHSNDLDVVATAEDGISAIEQVKRHKPDLILLDLHMPRMGGLEAISEIKKAKPDIIVLVLSALEDQYHIFESFRAGADDFIFKKDAKSKTIADHIMRAIEKKLVVQDEVHNHIFSALRKIDPAQLDLGITRLTGAEQSILALAAHRGLSQKEVAAKLDLSEKTVNKHFEHIYDKLGAHHLGHAVCLAIKYNLIDAGGAEGGDK